jgi:DNA primase
MVARFRRSSGGSLRSEELERIRSALDPIAYISTYTPLKRSGRGFAGLCPFHREKTPSFHVSPEGLFYCFGCKVSGDIFRFIELKEGVSFPEAVAIAADFAGIMLEPRIPSDREEKPSFSREEGYELLRQVSSFYEEIFLHHPSATRARDYLKERGYTERFWQGRFGYAPPSSSFLMDFLKKISASLDLARAVGLLNASYGERFSRRLLFPIHDEHGRVCGFGGRVLESGEEPKYLNSPDSPWFHKGQILYGFYHSLPFLEREGMIVLCEGYFDVLRFHQAGVPCAVAPLGTALTPRQAGRISSRAKRVILAMDRDPAGARAAFRAYLLLFERGVEVRALVWEEGKDPDEALRDKTEEEIRSLLSSAQEFLTLLTKELRSNSLPLAERRERAESYARELSELRDPVALDLICRELSEPLGLDYRALKEKAESLKPKEKEGRPPGAPSSGGDPPSHPEEILARLLLQEHLDRFRLREVFKDVKLHPWLSALLEGQELADPGYRSWLGRIRHLEPPRLKPQGLDLLFEEIRIQAEEKLQRERMKSLELKLRHFVDKGDKEGIARLLETLRSGKEDLYG